MTVDARRPGTGNFIDFRPLVGRTVKVYVRVYRIPKHWDISVGIGEERAAFIEYFYWTNWRKTRSLRLANKVRLNNICRMKKSTRNIFVRRRKIHEIFWSDEEEYTKYFDRTKKNTWYILVRRRRIHEIILVKRRRIHEIFWSDEEEYIKYFDQTKKNTRNILIRRRRIPCVYRTASKEFFNNTKVHEPIEANFTGCIQTLEDW